MIRTSRVAFLVLAWAFVAGVVVQARIDGLADTSVVSTQGAG